eukprot:TRINITY_DN3173_c0_g1_i1.p1 TRINITY_DN3173_c0_g1~~TRINITY_DN3173_c0_g1_i1.p1  ORF type:complete len:974 (+),score=292.68 TRINITY_DN3173_c0_g1_i1:302-3223(+)
MAVQVTPENVAQLCACLKESLEPDQNRRKNAETYLVASSKQPGFANLLLATLSKNDVDMGLRQAGAVFFKNYIKQNWANRDSAIISPQDRDAIKSIIVELMLNVPPLIQKQISTALQLISEQDFPNEWQSLLPDLIKRFQTQDFKVINGVLHTTHSILKRYRHQVKSDEVLAELKYILSILTQPYFDLLKATDQFVDQNLNNEAALSQLFLTIRRLFQIYYSLSYIDLPEFFEDNIQTFMQIFRKYLLFETKMNSLVGDEDDPKPSVLQQIQASVCHILNLYIGRYEEEFLPFLQTFVQDIWGLLIKLSLEAKYDVLATSAIGFLASVSSSVHHTLFKEPETLTLILEKIVVPNLKLREVDLEQFEDNPVEYIRRDIEGSDMDTRRRAATELVKGLRKFYDVQTTQICASYISTHIQQYQTNPKDNWLAKDVAIYLITAVAVRGATAQGGTTSVNNLVPIMDFFQTQIVPELQTERPISDVLKADALKFVSTFRSQIPKEAHAVLFTLLINNLGAKNYVVHTYAAHCIERLLVIKDTNASGASVYRYGSAEMKPFLATLLTNLFKLMDSESRENEYLMKALMRTLHTAQEEVVPYSATTTNALVNILMRICNNPTNPGFNHYLFESIATTISTIAKYKPADIANYERLLFVPFTAILKADIQEFGPYVFQILSLLLERTPSTVSQSYLAILPPLLEATLWERTGNVPALVRLLRAYLSKGSEQIRAGNYLLAILGIFQKLISSKIHDHEGFFLLESIVQFMQPADFGPHMKTIFTIVFSRLQTSKTTKFIKGFLVFMSFFIGKHGATFVMEQIDTVQQDLFAMILGSLWISNIQKVNGPIERKMACVAMARLLGETPRMMQPPYLPFWPQLLSAFISVSEGHEDETEAVADGGDADDIDIHGHATFSQLTLAAKEEQDPFKDINPRVLLAQNLARLSRENPGKILPMVQLGPEQQKFLTMYFQQSGIPEPYLV